MTRLATLLLATAALTAPLARATLPNSTLLNSTPHYAKGYLNVLLYQGRGTYGTEKVWNDGTHTIETTTLLNEAINDARDNNLVLYFPAGTYTINDTLKCYTATDAASHTNGIVMVGSTTGARPVIKLAAGASGFQAGQNGGVPKVMVEFKNFSDTTWTTEINDQGYDSMIRGIDINCNATTTSNNNTIGLYMTLAQECSIENVKVTATNAHTGIRGIPSQGWGAVNIEVEGGQYGIDTFITGQSSVGSTIAGLILRNQTVSSIRHTGHPLTIVGFEISSPSSDPSVAAVKLATEASGQSFAGALSLIDGTITVPSTFSGVAAVDNSTKRNLYLRNVYVTGTTNLVRSLTTVTGSSTAARIKEYSFTKQSSTSFDSTTLINATLTPTPAPLYNGELADITTGTAPSDLRTKHVWASLPSVDDTDAYDPAFTLVSGVATVSASTFQNVLNNHAKVFLRKGTYLIDGPITLNGNNRLFGAARRLTLLQPNWTPTAAATFITTVNSSTATTYLGDLQITIPKIGPSDGSGDFFSALSWQAGASSMLHIASIGETGTGFPTTAKSLVKVRNNGGGRWYFFGRRNGVGMQNYDFRILDVWNTTGQPLWMYGLNMEHARSDTAAVFTDCANIRIFGVKTEFAGEYDTNAPKYLSITFFEFNDVTNVALIGYSALRYAPNPGSNVIEFHSSSTTVHSNKVLAALVSPQNDNNPSTPPVGTLYEVYNPPTVNQVDYPTTVSLFKRGTITDADDALMAHSNPSY